MADGFLKLCGGKISNPNVYTFSYYFLRIFPEPSIPGLALPKAFESLESHIDTAANLCKLKGANESQVASLLIVCGELQRLLRLAFIGRERMHLICLWFNFLSSFFFEENGILASRIEMLSRYQDDFIRKCGMCVILY